MIGDEEKIMDGAGWLEVELDGITVINPKTTDRLEEYVNVLYELTEYVIFFTLKINIFVRFIV